MENGASRSLVADPFKYLSIHALENSCDEKNGCGYRSRVNGEYTVQRQEDVQVKIIVERNKSYRKFFRSSVFVFGKENDGDGR